MDIGEQLHEALIEIGKILRPARILKKHRTDIKYPFGVMLPPKKMLTPRG